MPTLPFSQEILTEQQEIDKQQAELESLRAEDASLKEPDSNNVEKGIETKRQQDKILSLKETLIKNTICKYNSEFDCRNKRKSIRT